ncbi:response regulator [Chondrinema litorale]|uniref:response regulator n=1 Tax=Chondrinema litorale TaxID=2994555 RepID=UPI002542FD4B|nr:response regulator [Chondrinema litorale]UZR99794.1 response regulator [Chondrinema litorale]
MDYLIIEDDDIDIMITKRMIEIVSPNISPVALQNGKQAMSYLEHRWQDRSLPTLKFIILDLIMPIMDGFEFLEMYSKSLYKKFPTVPLIILTNSYDQVDKIHTQSYPFVSTYTEKPLNKNLLKTFL